MATTNTVIEMTKFIVCLGWSHAQGHKSVVYVTETCRIIEWNARNSEQNRCRPRSISRAYTCN